MKYFKVNLVWEDIMSFDYREAVDLKSLARFSVTELRDHLRHALEGG